MRLLIVTDGVPSRDPELGDGSSMISFEIIRALPEQFVVTLVIVGMTHEVPTEIAQRCDRVIQFGIRGHAVALVRSVFSRLQVGAEERSVARVRKCVREISAQNDVTFLHGQHVPFLAREVRGPMVLQVVDPWSMRMEMDAQLGPRLLGIYRRAKARRVLAFERSIPSRARLLTVGSEDATRWAARIGRDVRGVANGVDSVERGPRQPGPLAVCFTGSLSYPPNVESANVLVKEIAPLVWREFPETRFILAGRQPDRSVIGLSGEKVKVLANVPRMADVFDAADIAVFPDREGLGIRNSVREALASGIPVVATATAAREVKDQISLTVAEGSKGIAREVVRLLRMIDPAGERQKTDHAGGRSWRVVTDEYIEEFERARSGLL